MRRHGTRLPAIRDDPDRRDSNCGVPLRKEAQSGVSYVAALLCQAEENSSQSDYGVLFLRTFGIAVWDRCKLDVDQFVNNGDFHVGQHGLIWERVIVCR